MSRVVGCSVALLVAGCGAAAFDPQFREREEPALTRVLGELEAAPARTDPPLVALVRRSPPALALWDLREGRERWSVEADVRTTPLFAGNFLVQAEADGIVGRRLSDGARAFGLGDPELRLVHADGEGDAIVIALARGTGESPSGVVVGGRGGPQWSHELPLPVGAPAVVGGLVVVPWAQQRISVLDLASGEERLRVRSEHAVVGRVLRGRRVYLGQHRVFPLEPDRLAGRRRDGIEPRGRTLPGQPPTLEDGYHVRYEPEGARNRVRLAWALADDEGEAAIADDALYFAFYRMLFGLAAGGDELRWATDLGSDVVGAQALPGGVLLATEDGHLRFVGADGRARLDADTGGALRAAEIRAAGFEAPSAEPAAAVPLRAQLEGLARMSDSRLGGGRALAIRFLAREDDAAVTASLIELCTDRRDALARSAACAALAERTSGGNHVQAALRERSSFLEDRSPPPVGALARAAAAMRLRVGQDLVAHLEDPSTPADELPGLLDGLGRLGDRRAAPPIEAFLRLYHADAADAATAEAIGAAAEALLRLDPNRLDTVRQLSDDPLAPAPARARLARVLLPPAAAPAAPSPQPAPRPAPPPAPAGPDLPERITSDMRARILAPVERQLARCLERPGQEALPSLRVVIVLGDEGEVQVVSTTPTESATCVEPHIRSRTWPRTRRGREVLVHVVRR